MKDFRQLQVWSKAHKLTLTVYKTTALFPRDERFGLVSQIRRCCESIPANIAEGCGKNGNAELHRYLQISSGSASELDYHLLLSRDLGFLAESDYATLCEMNNEVRRMLTSLIQRVSRDRYSKTNC